MKLGLHIIKFPSGRFGFVGNMPRELGHEVEASTSDVLGGRSYRATDGSLKVTKFPSFATEAEAREHAEQVFISIGRAGGNTINSPHREAWETLRDEQYTA